MSMPTNQRLSPRPYSILVCVVATYLLTGCQNLIELPDLAPPSSSFLSIAGVESSELVDDRTFHLRYRQWINHQDTSQGTFLQSLYLRHWSPEVPVLLNTEGYFTNHQQSQSELSELFSANYMAVEHRYFGESVPEGPEYEFLNVEQAAYDLHRIREAFREMYPQAWISTGVSKGGINALCYKYYFPEDVAATVAYAAPFSLHFPDDRSVGYTLQVEQSHDCIATMRNFQVEILRRKEAMLLLLAEYLEDLSSQYPYDPEQLLQRLVLGFRWSFWTNHSQYTCDDFPALTASDQSLFNWLVDVAPIGFYAFNNSQPFLPYYYQAATELGDFAPETHHLAPYWVGDIQSVSPTHYFLPRIGSSLPFSNEHILEIVDWLENEGEQVIYLYGEDDLWTSGAVQPQAGLDNVFLVAP
ncbi:MAG TPA: hypothetical protein DCP28_34350, partial [Cytophagales bacterium]|nr:hypothetical protein [Cytophagales bacterium]